MVDELCVIKDWFINLFSDKLIAIRLDEKDHGSTDSYTDGETWFYNNSLEMASFIDTLID